ncbi:MAG: hypothetical protein HN916_17665 [Anaerolineae bacterium]|jgi:hypothetical protein|nr:hypothetical protein [Anaerolineae bacterium]MBT7992186.1 hypothetical protein [Anaerolineae bacterium]
MQDTEQPKSHSKIESSRESTEEQKLRASDDETLYHFVDTIAIVQDIYKEEIFEVVEVPEKAWGKRLMKWIRSKFKKGK